MSNMGLQRPGQIFVDWFSSSQSTGGHFLRHGGVPGAVLCLSYVFSTPFFFFPSYNFLAHQVDDATIKWCLPIVAFAPCWIVLSCIPFSFLIVVPCVGFLVYSMYVLVSSCRFCSSPCISFGTMKCCLPLFLVLPLILLSYIRCSFFCGCKLCVGILFYTIHVLVGSTPVRSVFQIPPDTGEIYHDSP